MMRALFGICQWNKLGSVCIPALLSLGLAVAATASVPETYSVTILATEGGSGSYGINANGQVAFYEATSQGTRARFYNGTSTQDLGSLGGTDTTAFGINNSGQVIGNSMNSSGAWHAFSWTQAGGMVDLGTHTGTYSAASVLNGLGQVTGLFGTASENERGFSWNASGGMLDMGTLGGGLRSSTSGINDAGQVVGGAENASGVRRAFVWTQGTGMVDLGTLGGSFAEASDINNSGQIAGVAAVESGYAHAFLWTEAGGMVDLGTLGGDFSYANLINDAGQVTGSSGLSGGGEPHAFFWTQATGMLDIGTFGGYSTPYGLNSMGQVAGSSSMASGQARAFVWTQSDGLVNLNSRIPTAPAGLILESALSISDNGSIVASSNMGLVLLKPGSGQDEPFAAMTSTLSVSLGKDKNPDQKVKDKASDSFGMTASIALGANSNGILPISEAVILGIGNVIMEIPMGGFTPNGSGGFTYSGVTGGINLLASIESQGGSNYLFKTYGINGDLSAIVNPVTISIKIGSDAGATSVTAVYDAKEATNPFK